MCSLAKSHILKAQTFHASIIKKGLEYNVYQCNLLLQSYTKCYALSEAQKVLHFMPNPNVVSHNTILSGLFNSGLISEALNALYTAPLKDSHSWNIVISGCVRNQRIENAMTHFIKMRHGNVRPDNYTYSIVLPFCDLGFGYQIHAELVKVCSVSDYCLWTNLMQMYVGAGVIEDARKVFGEMPDRDLVTWNALISGYSKCGFSDTCLNLYKQLCREGVFADEYTYAITLNELVSHLLVTEAMQVHSIVIKLGFCYDSFIANSLLEMYAKCGLADYALTLFEEIPYKDVFSWTTVVTGFSQSGHLDDAMWLFHGMQLVDVKPNSFTFGGLLSGCATTNALQRGKQLHGLAIKHGFENNMVVASAISDMYSKCSEMQSAFTMFQSMPKRDVVSWNGIICGYAQNGEAMKALKLYDDMQQLEPFVIAPNEVTFVGVLSACSHNGLVKEGCYYFNDMIHKHKIEPKIEHYTCMADMLGRAGLVEEADALLLQMPFKPDAVMWSTLLAACKQHRNLRMAKRIYRYLEASRAWDSTNYVLLANSYAFVGGWDETLEIREMMDLRGLKKSAGCSWVEIGRHTHSFLSGDKLHPQIERVYEVLRSIYIQMCGRHECLLDFASDYQPAKILARLSL